MTRSQEHPPRPARADRGTWWARWMIGLGLVLIVLATLNLSSAGYGTRARREFSQRKSYDMVKPDVHRALPLTVALGMSGVILLVLSGRVRRGGGASSRDRDREA